MMARALITGILCLARWCRTKQSNLASHPSCNLGPRPSLWFKLLPRVMLEHYVSGILCVFCVVFTFHFSPTILTAEIKTRY